MKSTKFLEHLDTIKREGIKTVDLVVRNIDGHDALFTSSGELLANQVVGRGHEFYENTLDGQRSKTFRAAFHIDHRAVKHGDPVEPQE